MTIKKSKALAIVVWAGVTLLLTAPAVAQLIDKNKAPTSPTKESRRPSDSKLARGAAI